MVRAFSVWGRALGLALNLIRTFARRGQPVGAWRRYAPTAKLYPHPQATLLLALLAMLLLAACDGGTLPSSATATVPIEGTPGTPGTPTEDDILAGATTVTPVPSPVGLDESDRVGVYVSVISDMLGKEGKEIKRVFIGPYIGQGEHLDNPDEDTPIPGNLLPSLKKRDSLTTYEVRDFAEVVDISGEEGKVEGGGVLITLGPILNEAGNDNAVTVRGSIYRNRTSAEGNIYSLSRDPSAPTGWKLLTTVREWDAEQ